MNLESIIDTTRPLFRVAYSHETAQDFVQMVSAWKDEQSRPSLAVWKNELAEARESHKQNKTSTLQLAMVEERLIRQIIQTIRKEINSKKAAFDLAVVVKDKGADCTGYTQLLYVLGNSVGLSVSPIEVVEIMAFAPKPESGHCACLVKLTDGKSVLGDATLTGTLSEPFVLQDKYTKVGYYWELRDKINHKRLYSMIRILDENGLIAGIYNNRGCFYSVSGQDNTALLNFSKSIELDPKNVGTYVGRADTYNNLRQYDKAISDCNSALEICPKLAWLAYGNRGRAFHLSGQYKIAIADFTKAIELCPNDAKFYFNRAITYFVMGLPEKAVPDFRRGAELDPQYAPYALQVIHDHMKVLGNRARRLDPKYGDMFGKIFGSGTQSGDF